MTARTVKIGQFDIALGTIPHDVAMAYEHAAASMGLAKGVDRQRASEALREAEKAVLLAATPNILIKAAQSDRRTRSPT